MRKHLFILCMGIIGGLYVRAQNGETPNYANAAVLPPGAAQASKFTSSAVNLFTGVPNVSIPLYSYKNNNGLSLSVSLEYTGGSGIQVGEAPGIVGLGWYLSAGGSITRTVRGLPDDVPAYGYMYASAIPTDIRSNANKYYTDSIDSQQDIFQYNFPGHSGKFIIGKNGQIITIPYSKIRIIPAFQTAGSAYQTLKSFRIITEDGTKYDFDYPTNSTLTGIYNGLGYTTSWNVTQAISAFNTDTIHYEYTGGGSDYSWKPPQITYVNNSNGSRKTPYFTAGYGYANTAKISAIRLPDKTTLDFLYSLKYNYEDNNKALAKLKISDTTFRFGYLFDYQVSYVTGVVSGRGGHSYTVYDSSRLLLKSVTPFTAKEQQPGYKFDYNYPLFPRMGSFDDTIQNKRDHWGYFNYAVNLDTLIPQINGYSFGADREPNSGAIANTLMRYYLPTGGYIMYFYEGNTHYPYTKQNNNLQIAPATPSQNNITLNQVFNDQHQLVFMLDPSVVRTGSTPVSGVGDLNVTIKSTDGSITYKYTAVSLYNLFYTGMKTWTFNLPNGNYRLETNIPFVTGVTGSFPVNILWTNRTADTTQTATTTGGVRVSGVARTNGSVESYGDGMYEQYKYVLPDGRSSGILGDVPKYDYPYRETIINGGTTNIDYTAISSQPISTLDFAQGSPVGYSRVEIVRHSNVGSNTLGKEVQEYTDLRDINAQEFVSYFPNVPHDMRNWGLGLLKRLSMYDSSGVLVKRTVNNYQYDSIVYDNDNFKGVKLGHSQTTYNGDPYNPSTTKSKTYIGEHYYPSNGWIYLTSTYDTLFQPNGSINTNAATYQYDTNYNLVKLTTTYDRTRGLQKEQRMYYPYHYSVGGTIGVMRDSLIINQPVATETWIVGDGNPRITNASITTYRQLGYGEFKPDTIFVLESNKPVLQSTIGSFDATKVIRNRDWFKPQTYFSGFDAKGILSESKNVVTGEYSSIITDYDQNYVTAKTSNAAQSDIAYTSFESAGSGNWTIGSSSRNTTDHITGTKSYSLVNGNISKSSLNSSQKYLLTMWAKSGASFTVNGSGPGTAIASQQGWNLYSVKLTGITSVTISGTGTIDELRLHPEDANMVTSAYEPLIGVTSTTDANNTIIYTEYDGLNRPWLIRDKDKNIVKRLQYSDTVMHITLDTVWEYDHDECSATPGIRDSVFKNVNPFSDLYWVDNRVPQGALDCSCNTTGLPQFRVISGVCEQGQWRAVSSVWKKIGGTFMWECTWKYTCFSDGIDSGYSEITYSPTYCGLAFCE